jgi:hypothetical protein
LRVWSRQNRLPKPEKLPKNWPSRRIEGGRTIGSPFWGVKNVRRRQTPDTKGKIAGAAKRQGGLRA